MTDIESLFIERLDPIIKDFFPNKTSKENFVLFFYREVLSLYRDIGEKSIVDEIEKVGSNNIVDRNSFEKSIKDTMLFISKNYILSVYKTVLDEAMNSVKMDYETIDTVSNSYTGVNFRNKSIEYEVDKNTASFDIDIDSIPKTENFIGKPGKSGTSKIARSIDAITEPDRNTFSGIDLSTENGKNISSMEKFRLKRDEEDSTEEDLTKDASYLTEEAYSSIPKMSVDLDY